MRIFGIAGFKNAGKTTLVVDLVREMTRRGLRVATVKHAHHEFDIDHPGKDSFLHRQAGAAEVIVSSARRWAHISELNESPEPSLEELLAHLGDVDLVLIEGYKHGGHPRLEVRRSGQADGLLAAEHSEIAAIVCDDDVPESPVPVLKRSNINVIVDFVLAEVGLSAGTGD
jgi:molybdopterin-guanine dinucleotide biosynthesis protein MobB